MPSLSLSSTSGDPVVDPRDTAKYLLRVTAGPGYDASKHGLVHVNGAPYKISSSFVDASVKVRIRDYNGLPRSSPPNHAYFSSPQHQNDRYSISLAFTPKQDIPGDELIMGFDFDRPIRDRLPPLFKPALRLVTTVIDPGIFCDAYADEPYIYGAALSSFFLLRIGDKPEDAAAHQNQSESDEAETAAPTSSSELDAESSRPKALQRTSTRIVTEGASGNGEEYRASHHIPENAEKRRKYFLKPENLRAFTFEAGREYESDFFNPYLDFANFAVKLPGFSIGVAKYIDEKTHTLRYVLKNKRTNEVYAAVVFTLLFGQELKDALAGESRAPSISVSASDTQHEESGDDSSILTRSGSPAPPPARTDSPPVPAEQTEGMLSALGKWIPRVLRSGGTRSGAASPSSTAAAGGSGAASLASSRRGSEEISGGGEGEEGLGGEGVAETTGLDEARVAGMLREKFGNVP